jgi:endonuclease YncB( thermonuclease family)
VEGFVKLALMRIWGFGCLAVLLALTAASAWAGVITGKVRHVIDGDTLVLENGTHVRLLDINSPELAHDGAPAEPYAEEAKQALEHWANGRTVMIETGKHDHDQYGRLLGQVYLLPGHGWVNGTLVRDGFAHVYTFADNAMYPKELLDYEAKARAAKLGLWALPRWRVRDAATCCADEDIGTFEVVEGKVWDAAWVKNRRYKRTYLNFGKDWRTDFSVVIDGRDEKYFRQAGIKSLLLTDYYNDKRVRLHGYLQPVNGTLMRVTHPAQIEILGDK